MIAMPAAALSTPISLRLAIANSMPTRAASIANAHAEKAAFIDSQGRVVAS